MTAAWDGPGVVTLPGGARVRGRRLADPAPSPADYALLVAEGPVPDWPYERIRWPDFWLPLDPDAAVAALRRAHERAYAGARVEVACRGGIGRTGTPWPLSRSSTAWPRRPGWPGSGTRTTRARSRRPGSGGGCVASTDARRGRVLPG